MGETPDAGGFLILLLWLTIMWFLWLVATVPQTQNDFYREVEELIERFEKHRDDVEELLAQLDELLEERDEDEKS